MREVFGGRVLPNNSFKNEDEEGNKGALGIVRGLPREDEKVVEVERIKYLIKVNEHIKNLARRISLNLRMSENEREILANEIRELLNLVREIDKVVLNLDKDEIYIVGKILGRLECLYGLIAKEVEK